MTFARALLAAICAFLALSVASSEEDHVLTLDTGNFEDQINKHDFIVVMFFAPWCGHCKRLEPEFDRAARALAEEGSEIVLAKINGDDKKHKRLMRKYEVSGFPTLKVFRKDSLPPSTYKGPRGSDGLVAHLKKLAGPPSYKLISASDLRKTLDAEPVVVVGIFPRLDHPLFLSSFLPLARSLSSDFTFRHTTDVNLLPPKGPSLPSPLSLPVVRVYKHFDEGVADTQDLSPSPLSAFLHRHSLPRVVEFSQDANDRANLARVFAAPKNKSLLFLSYSLPDAAAFRASYLSASHLQPDSIHLVMGEASSNEHALKYFGLSLLDTPALIIHDPRSDAKFIRTGVMPEDIQTFLGEFQSGLASPSLKSEPTPASSSKGAVKTLVANTFKEVVTGGRKNVLLLLHAPWCPSCPSVGETLAEVGQALASSRDVVVGKMDFSLNDLPSDEFDVKAFPAVFLRTSAGAVLTYSGDYSKTDRKSVV